VPFRGLHLKILLVSDAWFPQVNGVVRTLSHVCRELRALGHEIEVISPDRFHTVPCPTYPQIRLAIAPGRRLELIAESFDPDCIHISTEGPLGLAARRWCRRNGLPFTTAFHTRFAESIELRCHMPVNWTYRALRWFHGGAARTMVATPSLRADLARRGFKNLTAWSRGVDTALFRPGPKEFLDLPRPIHLYVGRVAVEKNIEAFLELPLRGTKLIVGDGPARPGLQKRFPEAVFTGAKSGSELAAYFAASDVFVFPSRTDTFGLVLLEALASGIPVAAYPVTGPIDVISTDEVGALDDDLGAAVERALPLDPVACRRYALEHSWPRCAAQFAGNLEIIRPAVAATLVEAS
jgi:glycosyltransferase involved in cell wall biosynthesis